MSNTVFVSYLARRPNNVVLFLSTKLYSSLSPYAATISVNSSMQISAHLFISARACSSQGFVKQCSLENLSHEREREAREVSEEKTRKEGVSEKENAAWDAMFKFYECFSGLLAYNKSPVKRSPIDSNDKPRVGEQGIRHLELLHILILAFRHFQKSKKLKKRCA